MPEESWLTIKRENEVVSCLNEKESSTLSEEVLITVAYNLQALNGYVYKSDSLVRFTLQIF